jgi:hypothetical protein
MTNMDGIPYKSSQFLVPAEPKPGTWHPLTWEGIGFCIGSGLVAPFVWSADPSTRIDGVMIVGLFGAFLGLVYCISRRR